MASSGNAGGERVGVGSTRDWQRFRCVDRACCCLIALLVVVAARDVCVCSASGVCFQKNPLRTSPSTSRNPRFPFLTLFTFAQLARPAQGQFRVTLAQSPSARETTRIDWIGLDWIGSDLIQVDRRAAGGGPPSRSNDHARARVGAMQYKIQWVRAAAAARVHACRCAHARVTKRTEGTSSVQGGVSNSSEQDVGTGITRMGAGRGTARTSMSPRGAWSCRAIALQWLVAAALTVTPTLLLPAHAPVCDAIQSRRYSDTRPPTACL